MMASNQYRIYECENPECGLRFPGTEYIPRWNRCPMCRSQLQTMALIENPGERPDQQASRNPWRVEALLDNIRSAWNVGSIFRTCDGIGVGRIYLCGITPTPANAKVKKTALGAENAIHWEQANNGVNKARELKSQGSMLWALEDIPGASPLITLEYPLPEVPLVVIAGNELSGVDPGIIELCERVISIPMIGRKHSYNVAIAFSIALSFLVYRRAANATASPMDRVKYSPAPD